MLLSLDARVTAAPRQVSTEVGDETVILELQDGVYYGLDDVGSFIWRQLSEPRTVRDLRDAIVASYDIDADRCEEDLQAILQEMATSGLVQIEGAA